MKVPDHIHSHTKQLNGQSIASYVRQGLSWLLEA